MNIYDASDYREVVNDLIAGLKGKRGTIAKLAIQLKCHSTYVSQVATGKADFSVDQGLRFCSHFQLSPEQSEFFLDLLCRDRAATKEAKAHYQARLDRRLAELANIKKRWKMTETLTAEQELKYYSSWIPQAVHLFCQLPGKHTKESIARSLGLAQERVDRVLADLASLGFVEDALEGYRSLRDSVHLGRDSHLISRYHVNWRLKVINDLTLQGGGPGFHYSAVVSLSEETAREVERLINQHVDAARTAILPSPSERLYVHSLDFYPLIKDL